MAGEHEELRGFVRDAVGLLDAQAAGVRPDVEAMLARARRIAAEEPLASVLSSERGEGGGVVIPLGRGDAGATLGCDEDEDGGDAQAGLGAFTSALRAELDAKVHERSLAGIPPLVRRRRWGAVVGGILALAAALVLIVAGAGIVGRAQREGAGLANAAGDVAPTDVARGVVPGVVPAVREDREGVDSAGAVGEDAEGAPGIADGAVPEDRDGAASAEGGAVREDRGVAPAKVRGKRRGPVAQTGPSLEDEAQVLWQRGELAAAEQKLREVLRVAGGSRRAELAYGDLFALVRQMHGADRQAAVWREYLGKFPGGRFADDARAGLCQRTATGERAACWRDYLEKHPAGAHRGRAEAAIGGAGAGP